MGEHAPRILMVSGHAPPVLDGVGDCTAGLNRELVRQRPSWRWYWLSKRPRWYHSPLLRWPGLTLVRPNHSWNESGKALAERAVRWLRPDILHVQEQIHSFHETDGAVRIAGATTAPVVTTLHEYHIELPSVRFTTELVRRSAVVIANDARNAQRCREAAGREPDHCWWSGNSVPPPDPGWGVRPVPGRITTFGFIHANKALEVVHEALSRLVPAQPGLRWRIVGPFEPGSNPRHAEVAARVGGAWVEFTGGFRVADRRLRTILGESEVMVLPFGDGASLRRSTLHAAWAFGLPVVTTPPDPAEPAIVDGENCLLVREMTPDAWADAVGRVLSDSALADRLRAGSRAAGARFSWERLAALHIEMYEKLLAGRRG